MERYRKMTETNIGSLKRLINLIARRTKNKEKRFKSLKSERIFMTLKLTLQM